MISPCVIAVLDAGIDPDLVNGNVLPELSFAQTVEIPANIRAHGTQVCNSILAIAPGATVLPIRITNQFGQLNTPVFEEVLDWIIQNHKKTGIKIICAAFADYTHQQHDEHYTNSRVKNSMALLKQQGIITVTAAGNQQQYFEKTGAQGMAWPAILKEVISVGALANSQQIAQYSQRLNASANTGCFTTVFTLPMAPGDTSGATAAIAGVLAALHLKHPDITVPKLLELLNAQIQNIKDEEGILWPVLQYGP